MQLLTVIGADMSEHGVVVWSLVYLHDAMLTSQVVLRPYGPQTWDGTHKHILYTWPQPAAAKSLKYQLHQVCKAAENAPRTLGALVGFHPEISLKLIRRVHCLTKLELRTGFFIELETRMCCLVSRCMELEQQLILP